MLLTLPMLGQQTYKFATRDTLDLYLDVYAPAPGSETTFEGHVKPTVMFVFGGGFIGGRRDGEFQKAWFERLSKAGYGVVSIDYRLGMKGYQVGKGLDGALKASDQFLLEQDVMLGRARTIDALISDATLPSWGNVSMDSIYRSKQ